MPRPKSSVDVYIPRLGDVVEYNLYNEGLKIGIISGTEKDWFCIKNHVDIEGHILDLKYVKKVIFRLPEEIIERLEDSRIKESPEYAK